MRHPSTGPGRARGGDRAVTLVATEVVLLWPRGVDPPATVAEAGLWPVFVLVVGERSEVDAPAAAPLFELINRPRRGSELSVVSARCRWSIVDARNALVKIAMRAESPEPFTAEILLPARRVLGILEVAARGATIGVTTPSHAAKLSGRVDIRHALHEIVLVSCEPSMELARLADLLHRTVGPRH